MKITLLNIEKEGDNKDYNGGFGTTFQVGNSLLAKALEKVRSKTAWFPLMSYGYLASIFKQNNHQVDVQTNTIPESDLVIIQGSTIRYSMEVEYIRKIKQQTSAKVGVIGPFPSVKPELFKEADFIIKGEPEEAACKIKDKIPKGIIKSNPIKDIDSLPFPDWSVFPLKKFSYQPIITKKPFTFIQASRGCPFLCNYCPYKVFGDYRQREIKKVIEEMEHLKEIGIKGVMFRDPMFSLNKKRIVELCKSMIEKKLDMEWGCETRIDSLDKEMIDVMHEAGMRAIKIGIESASPEILENCKRKPANIVNQEEMIAYCEKKGIRVIAFYIIGLPDDTRESVMSTIRYAKKLNTDFANFTICTPFPGTEFYNEIEGSIFEKNWENFDNFHPVFRHKNLSREELLELQEKAIVSYYYRPKFVLKYLKKKLRS